MSSVPGSRAGVEAEEVARPFLPWLGAPVARRERTGGVVQVKIAAAIEVNQATIARFEDGQFEPAATRSAHMRIVSSSQTSMFTCIFTSDMLQRQTRKRQRSTHPGSG